MQQESDSIYVSETDTNLPTLYQQQIFKSKYARWRDDVNRRENWPETVDRYLDALGKQVLSLGVDSDKWDSTRKFLRSNILELKALPSMRAMMSAGAALERDHMASYNCSYLAINRVEAFDETLYVLCCGTGVGFSVEQHNVEQLPAIPDVLSPSNMTILVEDSKIGWASALRQLIKELYNGAVPTWDVSRVRPAGSRLHTFGGRASGPEPLVDLFKYVVSLFENAKGRKLTSAECHGIMCKIGEIVVVGGVRRSALISLSDPDDIEMRGLKSGEWWIDHPEYALANNSAVWSFSPDRETFDQEWEALKNSGSGERGIINRAGIKEITRKKFRRNPNYEFEKVKLLLVITEIIEAVEALQTDKEAEEIADIFIRMLDFVESANVDIDAEIAKKIAKNKQRPYKHGHNF